MDLLKRADLFGRQGHAVDDDAGLIGSGLRACLAGADHRGEHRT